ncbi:major capsid protein [Stutzerimonas nosocomialis]|uniref:Major capsid protein n=1 Tax=Stutzerimonas nosocomialis TaxID=1056496 RepID=A0A5R9QIF8_9GAMM|nr:major capsid protein [Stutzerimonas nosocomialis]TLX65076.1 major capsid protein [Stutzerimonas nosocomialis]
MAAGYDTTTLLGVKQILPRFTPLFLQMFFPTVATFGTEEVAFDKIKKGIRLAPFVSPMASGRARRERGGQLINFKPAYLKPTDVVKPSRTLKRRPGEALNGELSPAQRMDAIRADILNDHEQEIVAREEWMAVQAVLTGKVIVEGEDYEAQEVDYYRSPENQVVLGGAAKWDTVDPETYDPTEDLEDWAANASGPVGVILMDKLAWRLFARFKKVQDKLETRRGSTSQLELGPQVEREIMRKGFFGEYEILVYTGKYEDAEGNKLNYMPDHTVLLAPASADNVMAYGGIQDARANDMGIVETTRYPSNWFTDNPSVEWLQTQSAPVPALFDADEFVVITVA